MSEHSVPLGQEFGGGDSDEADPVVANLQQSVNLANENCDRPVALAQTLSAQLREAQDRINQLEREAEGLGDQLLAEAKAIIQEVRSNADARVNRTIREADERIDRLKAEAQNQIGRLQNELAQATRGIDQVKDEAGTRIEAIKMEADARIDAVESEAKKRVDVIRRENEDKVIRLEADLTEAKDRADRAEQWVMLIRREIEDHLMPAMRDGPKPTNSAARLRLLSLPTPSRSWFRRLWLRVTSTAALGCRDLFWAGHQPENREGVFTGGPDIKRKIAPKSLERFKQRIREITRRAKGVSIKTTMEELAPYMRGWRGYFGFCETPEVLVALTRWVRLRLRATLWRQWKTPRRRRAALVALGVLGVLRNTAGSGRGPWHLARSKALSVGLSNAHFKSLGLPSLIEAR
jgi:hypothetical protein